MPKFERYYESIAPPFEWKLSRSDLETISFTASAQAKGHLELGPQKVKAQSIILRSQPVTAAQVPAPDPEEL